MKNKNIVLIIFVLQIIFFQPVVGQNKDKSKIPGGAVYKQLVAKKFGKMQRANAKIRNGSGATNLCSSFDAPTGYPENFGQTFNWCKEDKELFLVAFVNAADEYGISIDGVNEGASISVSSAAGTAYFSKDKGNPTISSIIGVAATVGEIVSPQLSPWINAAENFAKQQFKGTNEGTKRRDAFGLDPRTGLYARQEGGIIICLPEQGGAVLSGEKEWMQIKSHDTLMTNAIVKRYDQDCPASALGSFFLVNGDRNHNTRIAKQSGQIYILTWDWKHDDNAGFYKIFIHLKRNPRDHRTQ